MARELYRPQTAAADSGDWIHSVERVLRPGAKSSHVDFFRVLQGTTGGGLQPLSQAILLEEFPPEERGKAMAFW